MDTDAPAPCALPHTIFDDLKVDDVLGTSAAGREAFATAIERLRELAGLAQSPTFASDLALKREWRALRTNYPLGCLAYGAVVDEARARINRLRAMNTLAHAPTLSGEQAIVAGARLLPSDYHPNLPARARLAQIRVDRAQALERCLAEPVFDLPLGAAWTALLEVHGQRLVDPQSEQRALLAVRRVARLRELQALDPLVGWDRCVRLTELWSDELLGDCLEAAELCQEYRTAQQTICFANKLEEALAAQDHAAIESLLSGGTANITLPEHLAEQVRQFHQYQAECWQRRRQALVDAIIVGDRLAFREQFDLAMVSEVARDLPHRRRAIARMVEDVVLPEVVGEIRAGERNVSASISAREFEASWVFPSSRIVSHFRLGVTPDRPLPHAIPEDLVLLFDAVVTRTSTASCRASAVIPQLDLRAPALVVVWGIVLVDQETFVTEPIVLGEMPAPR